ncbi:MAG: hypothetical protein S0880_09135 [Actinomycetota bacterium]|nr:hypothetical protein [Actinomycetota bacterium]
MRARLLILPLTALVLVAGACSNDDDGDDAATTTTAPTTSTTEATTTTAEEPTTTTESSSTPETRPDDGSDTTDPSGGTGQASGDRPSSPGSEDFESPSDDALVEDLTDALLANGGGSLQPTEAEARCIATGMIDNVGLETLARAGLETSSGGFDPGQLPPEDLEAFADSFLACIDVETLFVYQLEAQLPDAISEESVRCLAADLNADGFLDEQLREVLLSGSSAAMTASPEFNEKMLGAVSACLSAEELLEFGTT